MEGDTPKLDEPRHTERRYPEIVVVALIAAVAFLTFYTMFGQWRFTASGQIVAQPTATPVETPEAASVPTEQPTPQAQPSPTQGPEKVRVANADVPVNMRAKPGTSAEVVVAVPVGTVLEIVGPDQKVDGQIWRNVKDPAGNVGYMLADFLVPVR